jgi:hypothetical protein
LDKAGLVVLVVEPFSGTLNKKYLIANDAHQGSSFPRFSPKNTKDGRSETTISN